nr:HNH endonuclease [Luteibacter sp. UNC138MFCol5.1]
MTTVRVNRYERSTAARAQCLAHFGTVCQACGIDFGVFYGAHGAGYIHVHHHLPLSSIKQSYVVDPIRDLVPVCANCHAMIHRRDPALTISELRALIRDARSDARGM